MIDFDYYKNYKGPHLVLAQIWKREDKKLFMEKKIIGKVNYILIKKYFPIKIIVINFMLNSYLITEENIGFMDLLVNKINFLIHHYIPQ